MGWRITFGGDALPLTEAHLTDPYLSRWKEGTVVDLDDLSPDVYDTIAAEEGEGSSWWSVYRAPAATGGRLYKIVVAAAATTDVEPPAKPETMRDAKALLALI